QILREANRQGLGINGEILLIERERKLSRAIDGVSQLPSPAVVSIKSRGLDIRCYREATRSKVVRADPQYIAEPCTIDRIGRGIHEFPQGVQAGIVEILRQERAPPIARSHWAEPVT